MARRRAQKVEAKAAAQQRAAAVLAAQRAREAQDRRRRLTIVGATLAVIALMVAGIVLAALNRSDSPPAPTTTGALAAASQRTLTSVPAATFDQVGLGAASTNNLPKVLKNPKPNQSNGKPTVLYFGAEYCPYCAALRWSAVVALSRFGTWAPLQTTQSVQEGSLPALATVSFAQGAHATLTSEYVDFRSYELNSNVLRNSQYTPLDTPSEDDKKTLETFNAPPYVAKGDAGGIPFMDFGGRAVQAGGVYDLKLLSGKTPDQVAASLKDPQDPLGRAVIGGANVLSAAICTATGGKPSTVCGSAGVKAATAKLTTVG